MDYKINCQTDISSLLSEAEPGRLILDEQSRESSLGEKFETARGSKNRVLNEMGNLSVS